MTPDDLSLLRAPGTPALSPDGRTAVFAVIRPDLDSDEYVGHLWQVPTDGSAPARAFTRGFRDTAPVWSPDGRWVAFLRAERKGKPQLFVVEAAGGEPVALTDAPLGVGEARWSPDSARLVFVARVPDEGRYEPEGDASAEAPRHLTTYQYRSDGIGFVGDRRQHLWLVDLPGALDATSGEGAVEVPTARRLTTGDVDVTGPRWWPDGRHVLAVAAVHDARDEDLRSDAVVVDTAVDEPAWPSPVTDAAGGSTLGVVGVEPEAAGGGLWVLAQDLGPDGRDFVGTQTALYRIDLPEGPTGPAAAPVRRTDPETVDLLPGVLAQVGDVVLVADQRRGDVTLLALAADAAGGERALTDGLVVRGLAASAGVAVLSVGTPTSAGEVHALDLASGALTPLTDLGAALADATGGVRVPEVLGATAPDGYPVHGWLTVPDSERYGPGPYPVVLMIHGGPFAQYTSALFDEVQVVVGAGYAVVHGNPRGSAGYGAEHGRTIRGRWGTVDADDVLALLDQALRDPRLDPDRVGVMGGSYGGYLTAWLTTQVHRFAGAIVERGFLDPVSFVGSSDIGWFFGGAYLGDPATDVAAVAAQSPMAQVGQVRTPTLVIHSEQDWRCPVEQGQRWFVELKRRGVPVELLLFPGEGHELSRSGRPSHRRARFEHVLRWWDTRLA